MREKKYVRVMLSLDIETNNILNIFSGLTKKNRSKIVRMVLLYFNEHPKELNQIIESEK